MTGIGRRLHGRIVQSAGGWPAGVQSARRTGARFRSTLVAGLVAAGVLAGAALEPAAEGAAEAPSGTSYHEPIARRLPVSSSFGEFRRNHYHGGIDFSTEGKVGEPIYAVADGWVWRVRASGSGYGLALYVRLDDGRTALYGHLDRFAPAIAAFVEAAQESLDRYEVDLSPPPLRLPVRRGDTIAWSGESGAGPPHLHFEIREGETADTGVNPRLFGFGDDDTMAPVIRRLIVTPLGAGSLVDGKPYRLSRTAVADGPGRWRLASPIDLTGRARFGLDVIDPAPRGNRLAPYRVFCDDPILGAAEQRLDRFDWKRTHEVERFYDFAEADRGRSFVVALEPRREPSRRGDTESEALPADRTTRFEIGAADHAGRDARLVVSLRHAVADSLVESVLLAGLPDVGASLPAAGVSAAFDPAGLVLRAPPGEKRWFSVLDPEWPRPPSFWERFVRRAPEPRLSLTPLAGGATLVAPPSRFVVRPRVISAPASSSGGGALTLHADTLDILGIVRGGPHDMRLGRLAISLPESAAFEAAWIGVTEAPAETADGLAPVGMIVRLDAPGVVLDRAARFALTVPGGVDTAQLSLYRRGGNNRWSRVGAVVGKDGTGGTTRYLGDFALFRDVSPPAVTVRAPLAGAVLKSSRPDIRIVITDRGSGVTWRGLSATIDGVPQILVYDPEARTLTGRSRRPLAPGAHRLAIVARDEAGNVTRRDIDFRVAG